MCLEAFGQYKKCFEAGGLNYSEFSKKSKKVPPTSSYFRILKKLGGEIGQKYQILISGSVEVGERNRHWHKYELKEFLTENPNKKISLTEITIRNEHDRDFKLSKEDLKGCGQNKNRKELTQRIDNFFLIKKPYKFLIN